MQVRNPWQWQRKTMNPLDIVFQIQTPWYGTFRGTGWSLDSGETLDASCVGGAILYSLYPSPKALTLANNGNVMTRHVSCKVLAGSAAITALTIAVGNCDMDFSGTIASTKTLQIIQRQNYAAITNDGSNAYDDWNYGGSHTSGWWLELAAGTNTMTVTYTGGSTDSYITLEYADGWA